ncbi:MAG: GNAT family N-acetyltransferase [Aristaeellaceae bacterium]
MTVTLEPIRIEQKSVLVQMMELFTYDFSEFSGKDISEYGYYGYAHIDDYWNEAGRYPFFIRVDGKLAGLVLIRSCCEYTDLPRPHCIAEFFVLRKYRRRGVGRAAARQSFDLFPGGWEVSVWPSNHAALAFWERVIRDCTGGNYAALTTQGMKVFTFVNG